VAPRQWVQTFPQLALDDASREILARWRSPVTVPGMNDEAHVDDPTDETRERALREFERSGDAPQSAYSDGLGGRTQTSRVHGPLVEALDDPDGMVRLNAMVALRDHLAPELLPVIERLLKDPDDYIRAYAVDYYAQLKPPDAGTRLVEALDDPDGMVRLNAMVALRDHLAPELLPVIERLLKDPDDYIRAYAVDYYAQLKRR
jgi:vesicle coat complex subunit